VRITATDEDFVSAAISQKDRFASADAAFSAHSRFLPVNVDGKITFVNSEELLFAKTLLKLGHDFRVDEHSVQFKIERSRSRISAASFILGHNSSLTLGWEKDGASIKTSAVFQFNDKVCI
jgi:hypothetical protein